MNIVITGGAGFLGTLLIQHLLSEADAGKIKLDSVISFDLIPTSVTDPRVRSITGEITDKDAVSQAVTENTDTIVHLASVLSGGSELDFDSATHVNIDGTRTLLEAARSVRELEKLLYLASSSRVRSLFSAESFLKQCRNTGPHSPPQLTVRPRPFARSWSTNTAVKGLLMHASVAYRQSPYGLESQTPRQAHLPAALSENHSTGFHPKFPFHMTR